MSSLLIYLFPKEDIPIPIFPLEDISFRINHILLTVHSKWILFLKIEFISKYILKEYFLKLLKIFLFVSLNSLMFSLRCPEF